MHFLPRFDILEDAIAVKTKAILINSPNNPTCVVYSNEFLRQPGELLTRKEQEYGSEIYLISDEVAFVSDIQQQRVLTVSGSGAGTPGYFRIVCCVEDSTLEGSIAGFREVARKYNLS